MATLTAAQIDDLPDSDFAYIEPGGEVVDGRTEPRSLRHFPIPDAAHVRAALARLGTSPFGERARARVEAAARRMGIGEPASKASEVKAEPMTVTQLDRWLDGKIPRRVLTVPFGGPIPSAKSALGVDLDGEWFDADTDLVCGIQALRETRDRLVDWHHVTFEPEGHHDPAGGRMKGAILGRVVLDESPEADGLWADFWANAGERRRKLVADLERRAVPLYGSSQPVRASVAKAPSGHIDRWGFAWWTVTTAPQNTYAVVPAMKAVLDEPTPGEVTVGAFKAFLTGFESLLSDLPQTSPGWAGDAAAKAGRRNSATDASLMQQAHDNLAEVLSLDCAMPQEGKAGLPASLRQYADEAAADARRLREALAR